MKFTVFVNNPFIFIPDRVLFLMQASINPSLALQDRETCFRARTAFTPQAKTSTSSPFHHERTHALNRFA